MPLLVDPPSGWLYGFPRPYTFVASREDLSVQEYDNELRQWFIDHGYPAKLIDEGNLRHCRFIGFHDELKALPK